MKKKICCALDFDCIGIRDTCDCTHVGIRTEMNDVRHHSSMYYSYQYYTYYYYHYCSVLMIFKVWHYLKKRQSTLLSVLVDCAFLTPCNIIQSLLYSDVILTRFKSSVLSLSFAQSYFKIFFV